MKNYLMLVMIAIFVKKSFGVNSKEYKVRDHCHFTGALRGAAHNSCNVNNKNQKWHQFYVTIFQIMESGDASLISSGLLDLFLMIIYLNTTQWRLKRFQSTLK